MKISDLKLKLLSVAVTIVLAALDQLTKLLAVTYIKPCETIPLISFGETECLNFTYCENTGMSFSLMEGQRFFLIIVPVLMLAAAEWYIFSGRAGKPHIIMTLAALAGGGLGNLIDRVFNGYVVDFIDFRLINFAIFNFADICVVVGGLLFVLFIGIEESRKEKEQKQEQEQKEEEQADDDT